jgi:hypothetical protein
LLARPGASSPSDSRFGACLVETAQGVLLSTTALAASGRRLSDAELAEMAAAVSGREPDRERIAQKRRRLSS